MTDTAPSADQHAVAAPPPHILVADTESYVCNVVRAALDADAYRVSRATTRSAAIRVLRSQHPDLMLVDLLLSRALGLPLALYAINRQVPVIFTTGDRKMRRILARAGCPVLAKPLNVQELTAAIGHSLADGSGMCRRCRDAWQRLVNDHRECDALLDCVGDLRLEMMAVFETARQKSCAV